MTRWFNVVLQTLGIAAQAVNALSVLKPETKATVGILIGAAQGIVALIAHAFNPDGSHASSPYEPKG